jgi:hypothetical protein
MAVLGRRRAAAPRLAPELDDEALGRVYKRVAAPSRAPGQVDVEIALVEQLFRQPGQDADRRLHRLGVLADVTGALARKWRHNRPQDPDALVLYAWSQVAEARSGGVAGQLPEALEDCRRAAAMRPDDCAPWVAELAAMRLPRRPWAEVEPIWRAVQQRDPHNRRAHMELLGYLSPEECGSLTALRDFASAVDASAPPGSPVAGLALTGEVWRYHRGREAGGASGIIADHYWLRPAVKDLLDAALERWPRPGYLIHAAAVADLNMLAYALVHTSRPEEAAPVFQRTGALVAAWPWSADGEPVAQFSHWHNRLSA